MKNISYLWPDAKIIKEVSFFHPLLIPTPVSCGFSGVAIKQTGFGIESHLKAQ
jgi:hypothetical protein